MGAVRVNGSTSGYVELAAPAVAGSVVMTLPATTGTLATTADTAAAGGMVLITSQAFTASTAINHNNTFSATYDYYRIMFTGVASSGPSIRLRVGGVNSATANHYNWAGRYEGTTASAFNSSTATEWQLYPGGYGYSHFVLDVLNPFLAEPSSVMAQGILFNAGGTQYAWWMNGLHQLSTSYDGFSLLWTSVTTGKISVYGYRK